MGKLHIPKRPTIRQSESGMIAMMTTMIMMIVITLIVLGFAQISRRTQRESLDRQLSTQAFYAAETAINDARQLFKTATNAGIAIPAKPDCTGTGPAGFYATNTTIDAAHGVSYSCLLVDPAPTKLVYGDITTTSVVVPMTSFDGSSFNSITLDWKSKLTSGSPTAGCPSTTNAAFSTSASWSCGYGVLRFDLVPASGNFDADTLRANTMTVFAVPFASGGTSSVAYAGGTANTNNRVGVACNSTSCTLNVTGLSQPSYYMRISSMYRNVSLQITAKNGLGSPIKISGAQAVVDATGKAQDVLRRIQVHVPVRNNSQNQLSDFAVQSNDSICKRYAVMNGYFATDLSSSVGSNLLCKP